MTARQPAKRPQGAKASPETGTIGLEPSNRAASSPAVIRGISVLRDGVSRARTLPSGRSKDPASAVGHYGLFSPPPAIVLDDLRTIAPRFGQDGHAALGGEEFDMAAWQAVRTMENAAAAFRLAIVECENELTHRTGLVIVAFHPEGWPIAVGELPAPPSAEPLTETAKNDLNRLSWYARNNLVSLLVHLPFASRRDNALAFAAYVERNDGRITYRYLARLFLYPSESSQWIGWQYASAPEDGGKPNG